MTTPLEARVTELEIKLMHQEQAADDLTAALLRQERDIKALVADLQRLRDRVLTEPRSGEEEKDAPPPHY